MEYSGGPDVATSTLTSERGEQKRIREGRAMEDAL